MLYAYFLDSDLNMTNSYKSLCDDFYLDMYVNTELDLPTERDTILSFFERIQKQYGSMASFYRSGESDYCLEENRSNGQYRWITLQADRICSGIVNPDDFEDAYAQDRLVLELMPYMLSVNSLDVDSIDVVCGMDFECPGSHDEVIAEALLKETPFGELLDWPHAKPIACSPTMVMALSEDCRTQGRIRIESKTSVFDPGREKSESTEAISLFFTVRRFPPSDEKFDPLASFTRQCELIEELMAEKIVPKFVQPLTSVIAEKRLK